MKFNDIRRKTKVINIGNKSIGGENDILIQSMTNTDTLDSNATIAQIKELENCGCDIVRLTVPNIESADTIKKIKQSDIKIPIVADIHFDYRVAVECAKCGVDKIRINPGNIGEKWKIKEVVDACKYYNIPIRIGVNSGSLEKNILEKYSHPCADAIAESAFYHVSLLEDFGFDNIVISVKSSNVKNMIDANRIIAKKCAYPIHLGVTEAGDIYSGIIKSSAGIGSLLCDGIGDTIRVSLTANPTEEVKAAKDLLSLLEFYNKGGINIVSCPTCGRTKIDLISLSAKFRAAVKDFDTEGVDIKVALMGCVVNGPGEAREADVGIAGGKGEAVLFKHGEIVGKISEDMIIPTLIKEMENIKVIKKGVK
jgi:(E)-4-hydroxy-3-methylbut-2-enyl-diphosphate synthase